MVGFLSLDYPAEKGEMLTKSAKRPIWTAQTAALLSNATDPLARVISAPHAFVARSGLFSGGQGWSNVAGTRKG
jgi:hypothetical protein